MVAAQRAMAGIILQTSLAAWPTLPWLPALGVLLGLIPAWLAPMPPLRARERAGGPSDINAADINNPDTRPDDIHPQHIGSTP